MVGHGLGGPHACEDHLPGVAGSGASGGLGGGLSSARPDGLQLDRGGGKSLLLDLATHLNLPTTRTTLSHPGRDPGEDAEREEEHGKMCRKSVNSEKIICLMLCF